MILPSCHWSNEIPGITDIDEHYHVLIKTHLHTICIAMFSTTISEIKLNQVEWAHHYSTNIYDILNFRSPMSGTKESR